MQETEGRPTMESDGSRLAYLRRRAEADPDDVSDGDSENTNQRRSDRGGEWITRTAATKILPYQIITTVYSACQCTVEYNAPAAQYGTAQCNAVICITNK